MTFTLQTPVSRLTRVGQTTAQRLARLNITTANDLLWHIPKAYEDVSNQSTIANLPLNTSITFRGTVGDIRTRKAQRRQLSITTALLFDETGDIQATWFNQHYLSKQLSIGEQYYFAGKVTQKNNQRHITNPTVEQLNTTTIHTGRIIPLYHLTAGITQKQIRFLLTQALPLATTITDPLPQSIRAQYQLISLQQALQKIHFPTSQQDIDTARTRLAFDELFYTQLAVQYAKQQHTTYQAPALPFQQDIIQTFVAKLPFTLTSDQKKAAWKILTDTQTTTPMNRILQGDVGSGKTVVAALVLLNAATNNTQAVLLAPTEILAAQHFQTLTNILGHTDRTLALHTRGQHLLYQNNTTKKTTAATIKTSIAAGKTHIIIGTHALLSDNITYQELSLIIVDEQHRFGVKQRKQLKDKSPDVIPHFLSMTATPIPRSLALTLYGDLSITVLKQKPANRIPITTTILTPHDYAPAYNTIRSEVQRGNQAFVICPLIAESDAISAADATQVHLHLANKIFPQYTVGLVHGQLSKQQKQTVMEQFRCGAINILVATAVVEVGVDIPNATVMLIESAERFGVAQLHQFRGRIGRSDKPSICYLATTSTNPQTLQRLAALVKHSNGFELAEFDLHTRGPGDVYGFTQSGIPQFKVASLGNTDLLQKTNLAARTVFVNHPTIDTLSTELQQHIATLANEIHFE